MGMIARDFIQSLSSNSILSGPEVSKLREQLAAEQLTADADVLARELVKQGKITKFQAVNIYQGHGKGLIFGDYVVLAKIGSGGMGHVYKAQHRRMKRLAAIKVLLPSLTSSAKNVQRFYQEVEVAAKLHHPNIVTTYDAGEAHGMHHLIMEFVDGSDLSKHVSKQGPLTVEQAINCVLQAARGLEHAHGQNIVHRDVKPANMLANRLGVIKVLDMGLARFTNPLADTTSPNVEALTECGQVMGTVDYMSPEQAADTRAADHRSDVYALGCTLYKLLTGTVPYPADTQVKKIIAHRTVPIPSLRAVRPEVPASLDHFYQRMLAKSPEDRVQTMTEVVRTFEAMLAGKDEEDSSISVLDEPEAADELQSFLQSIRSNPASNSSVIGRVGDTTTGRSAATGIGHVMPELLRSKPKRTALAVGAALLIGVVSVVWFVVGGNAPPATTPVAKVDPSTAPAAAVAPIPETKQTKAVPKVSAGPTVTPEKVPETAPKPTPAPTVVAKSEPPLPPKPTPISPTVDAANEVNQVSSVSSAKTSPATPPDKAATHVPQTLIVGAGPGQLADLKTAFQRAGPGDTILIRHRGPLPFEPVDLTGKTPLVIKGDVADGIDFWPILRQVELPKDKPLGDPAPGVFHGDRLDLVLEKIHLAVAGTNRAPCQAIFTLKSGRVEFKQCSLTVGVQREPHEESTLLPLVTARGGTEDRVEIALEQSYLRGGALGSCLTAANIGNVTVTTGATLWAGGPQPWLNVSNLRDQLVVTVTDSTIYNAVGLLRWYTETGMKTTVSPAATFRCERSLFVGPYSGQERLIDWRSAGGLAAAVAAGTVTWQGDLNVSHRYAGYYHDGTKTADLAAWKKLWGQTGVTFHRESDPMFRIWPDGHLLQETSAWDLHARYWRHPLKARQLKEPIGSDHEPLPVAPPMVFDRPISPPDLVQKPRGRPRILRVHQKEGPYKTLEAAFAEVQEDEIIEVVDNGPYVPRRNFDASPGDALLVIPADYLTLRAADNAQPVVILSGTSQQGTLPLLSHLAGATTRVLSLIASRNRGFLEIDGWHVQVRAASSLQHCVLYSIYPRWYRCSNCTFLMTLSDPLTPGNKPAEFTVHGTPRSYGSSHQWVENNLYLAAGVSTTYLRYGDAAPYTLVRNCLFDDRMFHGGDNPRPLFLEMRANSVFGDMWTIGKCGPLWVRAEDNFLLPTQQSILTVEDAGVLRGATHSGSNNAIWSGTAPLTPQEREAGANALFAGPLLKAPPVPDGPGSPRDPLQKYRLKKGQPAASMARDGGTVGVRFEYLPTLPPEPKM